MPTRIYSLAKELSIDSKELVDICSKLGITGKGSALASLSDEELDKVKSHLAGPKPEPEPEPEPEPSQAPVSAPAPLAKRKVSSAPEAPAAPVRNQNASRGDASKIKVLGAAANSGSSVGKKKSGSDESPKAPRRRQPVINVAPLPDVKTPPRPKPAEPKSQRPEIRLSKGAMTPKARPPAGKSSAPPESPQKPRSPAAGREVPLEAPAEGKTRGRRGREPGLAGMASARADRKKTLGNRGRQRTQGRPEDSMMRGRMRRTRTLSRRKGTNTAAPRKGKVVLELPCTVRTFSEAAGVSASRVQAELMNLGMMVTINQQIDLEHAELLADILSVELEFKQQETLEVSLLTQLRDREDDPADLEPRPPVVTFLGHVDHGKTSLLDSIIGIDVVSGEAGGITQHIRAYEIKKGGRSVSFVDTPGHEAFTEMRARGANVTDIAVLVVAADDGIMPQTEEAISHAKAAEVPIVVALNKIDLPGADPGKVMTQMTEYDLTPSEWGGDVEVVQTSAMTGDGIDTLLDTLLTIADLHEYQANPSRPAIGSCLESEQEGGRGVVAKLMVKNGTLNVGDVLVCGASYGRVKAMYDTLKPRVKLQNAGPSVPVNITGLNEAPDAGEAFYVLDDVAQAREIAEDRSHRTREESLGDRGQPKISFEEFQRRIAEGRLEGEELELVTLNLIIRADVRGSIEAIEKELTKIDHPEIHIKVLHKAVGGVTVGDVHLASASQAVIIGFNVIPDENARILAESRDVEIRRYDIIYKVTEDIKATLEGRLKPEERVIELGRALVKQLFPVGRAGNIAGCYVAQGSIERGCRMRVNRDGRTIGDYPLDSLRRIKEDVKEVPRGMECGIKLAGFGDVKQDDILEAYKIEEVARTL